MSLPFRVDHVPTGHTRAAEPSWWATWDEAVAEETRLHLAGVAKAVAWQCGEVA